MISKNQDENDDIKNFVNIFTHPFHVDINSTIQILNQITYDVIDVFLSRLLAVKKKKMNIFKVWQNGDVHLAQIPDFEMEYLKNHLAH